MTNSSLSAASGYGGWKPTAMQLLAATAHTLNTAHNACLR
jgi:hypothetical protein